MEDMDNTNLQNFYKFIYVCKKCDIEYGTDFIEKGEHLCPAHDLRFKENRKARKSK
jgi:hypothetical protein